MKSKQQHYDGTGVIDIQSTTKQHYSKPALVNLGTIAEVTQSGRGSLPDCSAPAGPRRPGRPPRP